MLRQRQMMTRKRRGSKTRHRHLGPVKVRRAETKIVPRSQEQEISQDIDFECLIASTRVTPASILTALINK